MFTVRPALPIVLAVSVLALSGPARSADLVQFQDGRELEVARVAVDGEMLILTFEGGGEMAVPAWRVAGWRPFERRAEGVQDVPDSPAPGQGWRHVAGSYADLIDAAARAHQVDPILLTAVARAESALDPRAVSPKGARGLMQLMPHTATRFGVTDVFDAGQSVDGGARYLRWLLERFSGRTDLALAGYNAGEAAVERYDGVPPYPETQNYVRKVMGDAARLGGGGGRIE